MSDKFKIVKVPIVVSIVMLLLAIIGGLPIGYYKLLRVVICGTGGYFAWVFYKLQKNAWVWIMGIIALIFNPMFPFYLGRDLWVVVDVITLLLFVIAIFNIKEKQK